jgi:hypothetical protein
MRSPELCCPAIGLGASKGGGRNSTQLFQLQIPVGRKNSIGVARLPIGTHDATRPG